MKKLLSLILALVMVFSLCTVSVLASSEASGEASGETQEDKPVIGISWKSDSQDYSRLAAVIEAAGGIPVELPQITSTAVTYDEEGDLTEDCMEESGMLKQEYADAIKELDFDETNLAEALEGIDGVVVTGGEDISPSLFADPMTEENEGEEINATRDISDYLLVAYCIENDISTLCICRGEQMLGIVSGVTFTQDIPNYYESLGVEYNDTHRMPADAENRTYARHDVDILDTDSLIYAIVGDTTLESVSSWHHQCIASVEGTNLEVTASTTADGVEIIEAIERTDKTFIMGVQFHPENDCAITLVDGEESLCDYDTCIAFFETLVLYAGGGSLDIASGEASGETAESYEDYPEIPADLEPGEEPPGGFGGID
ncbi:MAG: gamma-glutamyl-gamma-aminobutyrate hydrolase family protein [Oscillospiraceae bacterium]|nr:gamma-glutamyl-gamma-aminobutyrate hydrolase family protein [Oscillospiraceae bacterium]